MHVCEEICLIYAATAADLKCDLAYFMVIMCQMKLLLLAKCQFDSYIKLKNSKI